MCSKNDIGLEDTIHCKISHVYDSPHHIYVQKIPGIDRRENGALRMIGFSPPSYLWSFRILSDWAGTSQDCGQMIRLTGAVGRKQGPFGQ